VGRKNSDLRLFHFLRWDAATGKAVKSVQTLADANVHFSSDGTTAACWNDKDGYQLYHVRPNRKWRPLSLPYRPQRGSDLCCLSSDGRVVLLQIDGHCLYFVETASGQSSGCLFSSPEEQDVSIVRAVFSPDGKTVASTHQNGVVRLWDVATRTEIERFTGPRGRAGLIAFSPDSKTVATEARDNTVLIWKRHPPSDLELLWRELASANAETARWAIGKLTALPRQAVPFLEKHLPPKPKNDDRVRRLIADLDSDTYAVRQKATRELEKEGESVEEALEEVLENKPSLEMQRRALGVLAHLERARRKRTADSLREIRGVQVLESIGTEEAQRVLKKLSEGASGALRTREAQAALRRLEKTSR
jgi:hypothetical protein